MKQHTILIYAIIFTCIAGLLGFSKFDDDVIIKKIAKQLASWTADNPQEKVYLHLDKPYYAIGDDLWFKAYVTTGAEHKLSAISGILNVELINAQDSITKAIKVPLTSGMGWGSIKLLDSLKEGNYRIRAYTNWMRNNSDGYFFDKTIQVGNSISNVVFTKVNYTYTTTPNNQQKVNAIINYADINGKPYAGKDVSYEVQLDLRAVAKGRGVTDNIGNINLTFINNMPALQKSGTITTHIKIDNKLLAIPKIVPVKATSQKIDIQFFPESGYMVNGVRGKVAFKAVGSDGLGVDVKGSIVDNQNNVVMDIETQHLGMGAFTMTPETGKMYTAKLVYPDGSTNVVNLPSASDRGYLLSVYNTDAENILVKISLSQITFKENENAEINMVAQSGGNLIYAAKTKLESASFISRIPRSRFATGIVQFTLFSSNGDPLNERIFFIQNPDKLDLKLSTAKTTYAPREKVKLDIEARNNAQPVIGAFSVSVIDESKVPVDESDESTILSNILLTSDIKGYIEKPNYYFNNVSDKTKADLDILMLTQGYRRFEWKQLMANNFPPLAFTPEKALSITGHIKTRSGKPIPHAKVTMLSTTGGMFFMDTVADEQGMFAFRNLVFTDSVKFVIQSRTQKDKKNVEIELDNIQPQLITRNKNMPDIEVNISSTMAQYLLNSKKQYDSFLSFGLVTKSNFLSEVKIIEKKTIVKYSDNLNGPGKADQVITSDQLNYCSSLAICLQGKIPGVTFRGNQAFSVRSINMHGPQPMVIVLDGLTISEDDTEILDDITPDNVQTVEVLKSIGYTTLYGSRGASGILVITTKRGADAAASFERYAPGIITYKPIGYQRIKEFYSPQYDDPKNNAKIADLRTTIFWQPNIVTDKNGNAGISYFNADTPGNYRAVIEGIDADGNIARQVYRYKVQ